MKKAISWLLTLTLAFTCLIPAFSAAAANYTVPISNEGKRVVVMLSGDGDALYDKDGNQIGRASCRTATACLSLPICSPVSTTPPS